MKMDQQLFVEVNRIKKDIEKGKKHNIIIYNTHESRTI